MLYGNTQPEAQSGTLQGLSACSQAVIPCWRRSRYDKWRFFLRISIWSVSIWNGSMMVCRWYVRHELDYRVKTANWLSSCSFTVSCRCAAPAHNIIKLWMRGIARWHVIRFSVQSPEPHGRGFVQHCPRIRALEVAISALAPPLSGELISGRKGWCHDGEATRDETTKSPAHH